jgi:hypothetical protein
VIASAPSRSREQRMNALQRANQIRFARAQFKRRVRSAEREDAIAAVGDIVAEPPDWALAWRLREVLLAIPNLGTVKVGRFMLFAKISDRKTLGGLSDRQRHVVVQWLWTGEVEK